MAAQERAPRRQQLYKQTDAQLYSEARNDVYEGKFAAMREGFEGLARFNNLAFEADAVAKRARDRVGVVADVIIEQQQTALGSATQSERLLIRDALSVGVRERARSRHGVVGALIKNGQIRREHVNADGTLNTAALFQTEYFQREDRRGLLKILEGRRLSEKSVLRRRAAMYVVPQQSEEPIAEIPVAITEEEIVGPEVRGTVMKFPDAARPKKRKGFSPRRLVAVGLIGVGLAVAPITLRGDSSGEVVVSKVFADGKDDECEDEGGDDDGNNKVNNDTANNEVIIVTSETTPTPTPTASPTRTVSPTARPTETPSPTAILTVTPTRTSEPVPAPAQKPRAQSAPSVASQQQVGREQVAQQRPQKKVESPIKSDDEEVALRLVHEGKVVELVFDRPGSLGGALDAQIAMAMDPQLASQAQTDSRGKPAVLNLEDPVVNTRVHIVLEKAKENPGWLQKMREFGKRVTGKLNKPGSVNDDTIEAGTVFVPDMDALSNQTGIVFTANSN